jgi:transposase
MAGLADGQWAALEPLVEACRPHAKVPPSDLRRTVEAIIWRCANGAKWRAVPEELGPWWRAARIFIRWARLGVWDRLLTMARERGVELGMAFLDGTSVRAHAEAAGASKRGDLAEAAAQVRRMGVLVAAMGPRPWSSRAGRVGPSRSGSRRGRRTDSRAPFPCSTACRACRLMAAPSRGGRRPGLRQPRLPRPRPEPRSATRDPGLCDPGVSWRVIP